MRERHVIEKDRRLSIMTPEALTLEILLDIRDLLRGEVEHPKKITVLEAMIFSGENKQMRCACGKEWKHEGEHNEPLVS